LTKVDAAPIAYIELAGPVPISRAEVRTPSVQRLRSPSTRPD